MGTILCVLYDDPVDGYPHVICARRHSRRSSATPTDRLLPTPNAIDFKPGELLGSVSGELGLRKFLEGPGPHAGRDVGQGRPGLGVRAGAADAEVVISQPFWPAYLTAERIAQGAESQARDHRRHRLRPCRPAGGDRRRHHRRRGHLLQQHQRLRARGDDDPGARAQLHPVAIRWVVKGGWNIADCVARSYDLEGMQVGTVAAGRIGSAVLRRLKPFDVELHYTDRHRLPAEVEEELGVHVPPRAEAMVRRLRRRHDQCPAASRDRASVRRRAARQDEARRLPREHRARQDLRPRRDRPGAGVRAARRLRGRCVVPAAGATGSPVAHDASSRHDAAHVGIEPVGADAVRGGDARDPRCWFDERPIRDEYLIVADGGLAGVGAHSYSAGDTTSGSEDAARFTQG